MVREKQIHTAVFPQTSDFPALGHWKCRGLTSKSWSMRPVACRKQRTRDCRYVGRLRRIRVEGKSRYLQLNFLGQGGLVFMNRGAHILGDREYRVCQKKWGAYLRKETTDCKEEERR